MLRQLRSAEKMKRFLWMGLLILIIPAMVAFYGFGSSGSLGNAYRKNGTVATITYPDGAKGDIRGADLRMAKNYLENRTQRYAQDQGVMLDSLAINDIVDNRAILDQAINLDILRHYGQSHDLTVSMDEVNAMFQQQTTADQRRQLVEQWRRQGVSPEAKLEENRRGRELQKAAESIGEGVRVTYYEAWQEYLKNSENLVVDYKRFRPSDYMSSVTMTDKGTQEFFKEHQDKFRTPDQVQYQYVLVRKDDLKSSITLTDDEITSYYTAKKEDFRLPRKVEARQIFLKLPSPAELNTTSAAALTSITQAVKSKADDIYQRAAKGENFAKLAKTFTEEVDFPPRADSDTQTTATDNETTESGYLGLISEEVTGTWYGDQWTSTVFHMKPGSISRPIRTANGYTIVKVNKIVEGAIQPLDKVRPVVEKHIRDEEVEPIFNNLGEDMEKIAERVTNLEQIAKETSTTMVTSPKVGAQDKFVPGIGMLGDLEEPIHDLHKGGRSDVLSDTQRHLVIRIKQEFPAHNPPLKEVRGRVEQAYKQQLSEDAARADADKLFKKSKDFDSFQAALKDDGTTYTRSRPFKRPEISSILGGPVKNFADDTAGIKKGEVRMSQIGRPGQLQSFAVWHLQTITEPSKTDFAKDLSRITQSLAERKREITVLEYIRDQREKIKDKIEIVPDFL